MKEFIFNEDKRCMNPNRIEGGNKEFWFEIQTACKDGKWYHGHHYWTRGHTFEWDVYLNTNCCDTEHEAIVDEARHIYSFERENKYSGVPESIFKELKEMIAKYNNPQLSLGL